MSHHMMLKLIPLAVLLTALLSLFLPCFNQVEYMTFKQYTKLYNLHFETKFQERYREAIYNSNVILIQAHNSLKNNTYLMGINQFTYLTQQQFVETFLGYVPLEESKMHVDDTYLKVDELDWVSKGAVTGIKNQGSCGSCWAFSATGSLEGISKISYGNLQSFSEQQLMDCSSSYGTYGCNGGSTEGALNYTAHNGITTEGSYPYRGMKGSCMINQGNFKISGFDVARGCTAVTNMLLQKPLSTAVDATYWSPYKSGIFSNCGTIIQNHAVLLVGIQDDYWKVKNSWGLTWGENGYIKLARGNTCGLCTRAAYATK